ANVADGQQRRFYNVRDESAYPPIAALKRHARASHSCHEETHAPLFNPLEVRASTVATLHSIAVASAEISGGMSKLRALAVFRLIINSNRVACSIGRSVGLLPLRILSTNAPALRQICGKSTP